MNWKTWVPLIIAVILGLIAAKVGRDMLVSRQEGGGDTRVVRIVVARRDVPPGHTLETNDLTAAAFPPESVPKGSFKREAEVTGRVTASAMVQGEPVLESSLAGNGSGSGAQAVVPAGMRAVTIEINEVSGVGGLLVPGCRVDVVSTLPDQESKHSVARTIVQNVKVLAVGQRLSLSSVNGKSESAVSAEAAVAKSVTLLVKPREAEAIELASTSGKMRLVLRGAFDEALRSGEDGLSVADLLGTRKTSVQPVEQVRVEQPTTKPVEVVVVQPRVATPQTRKHVVEFIRGTIVSRGEFEVSIDSKGNEVIGNNPTEQIEN